MSPQAFCTLRPIAGAAFALLLAATANAAPPAGSPPVVAPAAAQAAPAASDAPLAQTAQAGPAAAGTAPAVGVLPPAVGAGSNPAAPAEPQGLGIGTLSAKDLAAAAGRMVLQAGTYRCELNRNVEIRQISPDGQTMVINWLGKTHSLQAVNARSGALRFEDTAAGLVWLVIVGKSMLLDSRKGQQLANECQL